MKHVIIICLLILPFTAEARRGYVYQNSFEAYGEGYAKNLANLANDKISNLPDDQREKCEQRYGHILNDGLIDIRVAMGYLDWTTGSVVNSGGRSYGYSPSIDIGAYYALRELITSRCRGNLQLCRFQETPGNPYVFTKNVTVLGRPVRARIEIQFASATEYLNNNVGSAAQEQRTAYMQNYYDQALQDADAAFYFGHSRNGGGPDFAPPKFIPGTNKVNYAGYYKKYRPGFNKMLQSLSNPSRQADVIGMMSCNSRDNFMSKLRSTAPRSGVITSTAVLTVEEVYTAMIGGMDGLLRGQCQKSYYKSLRMTQRNADNITMDGMFE
ncbi:hypothetical protein DOM22_01865 [Bdellovibrio sp. ZAP7]|uniref:hypothetical protein n=1 Tax=Bdellovibrio sp. ZAP7 TaxID=2231053 RepID=UPI00115C0E64|nr:hypothetical protein [Bdellovibrio sp. ZAP7]QDK43995.1 hypothetical protein DOM22_01865 [Bdellovibrio sp. ZAP7]